MGHALIVQGGWAGHDPQGVAGVLAEALTAQDFPVRVSDTLSSFGDAELVGAADVIVLVWTMGTIERRQLEALLEAVRTGTGFAALHGTNFTFHGEAEYQYLIGAQFVAHPGGDGVTYQVNVSDAGSPITEGLRDFTVTSEHYYMHVDPGNRVLASTWFGDVVMPVTYTKMYGQGRVFYCSLGHTVETLKQPEVLTMMTRGILWAAAGKRALNAS